MGNQRNTQLMQVILDGATSLTDEKKAQLKDSLLKLMQGFDDKLAKLNQNNQALLQEIRDQVKVAVAENMIGHLNQAKPIPSQHLYSLGTKTAEAVAPLYKKNKSLASAQKTVKLSLENNGSVSLNDATTKRRKP